MQHGQEEGAHGGPRATAVLLGCAPVVRAPRAGGRGGAGGRTWSQVLGVVGHQLSGRVQLEVRVSGRAPAHASPDQRALVPAHLSSELLERAAHLPPEAPRVGEERRAALRSATVRAPQQVGVSVSSEPGLRVLASDPESHGVSHVVGGPRAPHVLTGVEPAPGGHRAPAWSVPHRGGEPLLQENQHPEREGPQRQHLISENKLCLI